MRERVVVVGATSAIAQEAARRFAADGASFLLVARDEGRARVVAADLVARGASGADVLTVDCAAQDAADKIAAACWTTNGAQASVMLLAYGSLTDQKRAETDIEYLASELHTNFVSAARILTVAATHLEAMKKGAIVVLSSVAGERGRQSNYVYGAAKGALTIFVEGLRNRLSKSGVQVLTVKPGFVDTPMTASFKKGPLWASPAVVGEGIYYAVQSRKDEVYLPWFWWPIMAIIRGIPEVIFKRLSL